MPRRAAPTTNLAAAGLLAALAGLTPLAAEDTATMPTTAAPLPRADFLPPRPADHTHAWWAEGFPSHTPAAPWRRVIQTGVYAMALDTDTLRIPHFGRLAATGGYAAEGTAAGARWQALPAADLRLTITVEGKAYRCTGGGPWTAFTGPRLIASGRFVQQADVTDLTFSATAGSRLNVEARFETVAWPDRLALILAARPGLKPIPAGEACFGRIGGGYGFDGSNHLEIPHDPDLEPAHLTLEFWAFVPTDCRAATRHYPWLACKNGSEWAEGNYGMALLDGRPRAFLNIGGGRDNVFSVDAQGSPLLKSDAWNHLAMTYDGSALRLYLNGRPAGERRIDRPRVPGTGGLAFGRRQDNAGDGYHFRGALDEIRLYHRAIGPDEVKARAERPETTLAAGGPARAWSFRAAGEAAATRPGEVWRDAALEIRLTGTGVDAIGRLELPPGQEWSAPEWRETGLTVAFDGDAAAEAAEPVRVTAAEVPSNAERPVAFEPLRGWFRVDLNGIEPVVPRADPEAANDAMERVRLRLANPAASEQVARLLFAKTAGGFRQRLGAAITGMSAVLRDHDGQPTGIPVQLSKNWHGRPEGGVYAGTWFNGFSQVRLPAASEVDLELCIVYGHWGGVPAASHAQLCLIGWGSNQLWDQSALGSWGESICYEPDQVQAQAAVLDVRPVMVLGMHSNRKWQWTRNVGGGDFFRCFDPAGKRLFPAGMKTTYRRQGPVLTEVTYAGSTAGGAVRHAATVSLHRGDDIVRGVYRLRLDVVAPLDFSRFVVFQIGADTYSYTGERRMALGNETGLVREWDTQWGGSRYRTEPMAGVGRVPWISLHEAVSRAGGARPAGGWANRGIVIREWQARLGGREAGPWVAEYGVKARGVDTSTVDILPPPGVHRFVPGDFIEATFEHLVVPQSADEYYGPNARLRAVLETGANTWRPVYREAVGNDLEVEATVGAAEGRRPAVRVRAVDGQAVFAVTGGLAYLPITVCGLRTWRSPRLEARLPDGPWQTVDQAVHGNDFWQTDYDAESATWEISFSVPSDSPGDERVRREYRFTALP